MQADQDASAADPGETPAGPALGDGAGSGWRGSIALLRRNADFRRLFFAQMISYAGDWFLTVALLGLALEGGGSLFLAALVVVVQMLPFFFSSPLGGFLADRFDRQQLMVWTDFVRGAICVGALLLGAAHLLWVAIGLQAIESALAGLFEPASQAAIPNVVDEADLSIANAMLGSLWGTMLAVGAALGGLVAAWLGREAAFIGDALSFVISAALLLRITRPFSEASTLEQAHDEDRPGFVASATESLRYARTDRRVLALIAVKTGFGLAGGIGIVLLPILADRTFRGGEVGIGIILAGRGIGALIGPFLGRRIAGDALGGLFRAIGLALFGFGLVYLFLPLAPSVAVAAVFAAAAHIGGGAQYMLSSYGLQRIVPDHIRGRVFALDVALITFTLSVSCLLAAGAATLWGVGVAISALAALDLGFAITWWLATRKLRLLP